jgi:hypothetical protein
MPLRLSEQQYQELIGKALNSPESPPQSCLGKLAPPAQVPPPPPKQPASTPGSSPGAPRPRKRQQPREVDLRLRRPFRTGLWAGLGADLGFHFGNWLIRQLKEAAIGLLVIAAVWLLATNAPDASTAGMVVLAGLFVLVRLVLWR